MLKEEEFSNEVKSLEKKIEEVGIKPGLVFNIEYDGEVDGNDVKFDGIVVGVKRSINAIYPHIEFKLLSELKEVVNINFIEPEKCGEPTNDKFTKEMLIDGVFVDLASVEDFLKEIKLGKIKKELYLNERKKIEAALEELNAFIKAAGIED